MNQPQHGAHRSSSGTTAEHAHTGVQNPGNHAVEWIIGFLIAAAFVAILMWWFSGREARRIQRERDAAERASQEAARRLEIAARAEAERQRAKHAEYERVRLIWDAAERAADAPCKTSLILHPQEIVGYATTAERIITHKVGHKSDRVSLRSGATTGRTQHQGTSKSGSAGFGAWGMREGSSQGISSGVGQYASEQASTGVGHTYSQDDVRTEVVDHGQLILTSQRVVFQGDNVSFEIPMEKVIGFHFRDDSRLVIDYAKRVTGECYAITDPLAMRIAVSKRLHEPGFEVEKPAILQADVPPQHP